MTLSAAPRPSPAQIAELRRIIAEPTQAVYTDPVLEGYAARHPRKDSEGRKPTDPAWTPTWDLYRAGKAIWLEKAAAVASAYDFNGGAGGSFSRSQLHAQYTAQAQACGRQSAARSVETSDDLGSAPSYKLGYPSNYD